MGDLDLLVWGLLALSAACFLAFALWPRSSPRGQLEVVPAADHAPRAASSGDTVAPNPEQTTTTTVVDNTPATSDAAPLARLTDMLRLRRCRGRCDWWKQDWRSTGGLAVTSSRATA
jgi:hypothetical protein